MGHILNILHCNINRVHNQNHLGYIPNLDKFGEFPLVCVQHLCFAFPRGLGPLRERKPLGLGTYLSFQPNGLKPSSFRKLFKRVIGFWSDTHILEGVRETKITDECPKKKIETL